MLCHELITISLMYLYHGIHEIHGLVITNHASHLLLGGNPPIAIP